MLFYVFIMTYIYISYNDMYIWIYDIICIYAHIYDYPRC